MTGQGLKGQRKHSPDWFGLQGHPSPIAEPVFYEGGPARGASDFSKTLVFGLTLIGLPFAVGAIVRASGCVIGYQRRILRDRWLARPRPRQDQSYGQISERCASVFPGFVCLGRTMVLAA